MKSTIFILSALMMKAFIIMSAQQNPLIPIDTEFTNTFVSSLSELSALQPGKARCDGAIKIADALDYYIRNAVLLRLEDDAKEAYGVLSPAHDALCVYLTDVDTYLPRAYQYLYNYTLLRKAILNNAISLSEKRLRECTSDLDDYTSKRDSLLAINPQRGSKEWEEASNIHLTLFKPAIRSTNTGLAANYVGLCCDCKTVSDALKRVMTKSHAIEFVAYNHPINGESFFMLTVENIVSIPFCVNSFTRTQLDTALACENSDEAVFNLIWKPFFERYDRIFQCFYSPDGSLTPKLIEMGCEHMKKHGYSFYANPSLAIKISEEE